MKGYTDLLNRLRQKECNLCEEAADAIEFLSELVEHETNAIIVMGKSIEKLNGGDK